MNIDLINKVSLKSKGLISRNEVEAKISLNEDLGIRFILDNAAVIEAKIDNLYSTQRNTVIANGEDCVCLTEHFLAACALKKINNIDVELSETELPFGDGSANLWIDFFNQNDFSSVTDESYDLDQEYLICDENDESRFIKISPAANFKLSYQLDWDHPKIGKQKFEWNSLYDSINEIANARTFSTDAENKMLGLEDWIVGITEDSFTQELRFVDEPVRHKALDLVGDLMLSGINPLNINMHVESNKGGHELNSKLSKFLAEHFSK